MFSSKPSVCILLLAAGLGACTDNDPTMPLRDVPSFDVQSTISGQWAVSSGAVGKSGPLTTIADNFSVTIRFKSLGGFVPVSLVTNRGPAGTGWAVALQPAAGGVQRLAISGINGMITAVMVENGVWHDLEVGRRSGSWYAVLNGVEHNLGSTVIATSPPNTQNGTFNTTAAVDYIIVRDLAQNSVIDEFQMEEGSGNVTTGANGTVLNLSGMVWIANNFGPESGGEAITACGTIITSSGKYTLARDLINCASHGIDVRASDVKIDLNGHTIDGVGPFAGIAVGVGVPGGVRGINITGLGDIRQFNAGIVFEGVEDSRVFDVVIHHGGFGFAVNAGFAVNEPEHHSSGNLFRSIRLQFNQNHGFTLNGATANNFRDNFSEANGDVGILLFNAVGNTVKSNEVVRNRTNIRAVAGIASQNVIMDNVALFAGLFDLEEQNGNCTTNTWKKNTFGTRNLQCIQ